MKELNAYHAENTLHLLLLLLLLLLLYRQMPVLPEVNAKGL